MPPKTKTKTEHIAEASTALATSLGQSQAATVQAQEKRQHVSVPTQQSFELARHQLERLFKKDQPEYWVIKRILAWQSVHALVNVTGTTSHSSWVELFGEAVREEMRKGVKS